MIRVKICGIASFDDVAACSAAGADALGFIFYSRSPRRLSHEAARSLTAVTPAFVSTVGVFANDPADAITSAIERCRLDILQFSGDESPEFCGSFGKPTIVASRGRRWTAKDRSTARAIAVIVDSWSADEYGGTGRVVPADKAMKAREDHEGAAIVLAGGLTPSNVGHLVRSVKPDAVDVRTGVERDGKKDPELVRTFVVAARTALG